MLNVNILRFDMVQDQVNAFTYFPFSSSYCERIEMTLLGAMNNNNSAALQDNIFPNKLTDFHGCPLWLATYNVAPYMILQQTDDGSYITKGIEGKLYHELAAQLNFRPMVRVGKEIYTGGAKENFHMLRKKEVNLTMFAIVNTVERSKEFTASFPYAYVSVVFTTPHGPPYSPLEKLILPFESFVWLNVVIVIGTALILTIYASYSSKKWRDFIFGAKNRTPFLNFINLTLGGAVTQAPVRNFARTIFLIWLLGSLVLRSSYQGALFRFIQSQKPAVEIDSLEKLVQFNFSIYSSVQILRLLEIGSPHLSKKCVVNCQIANELNLSFLTFSGFFFLKPQASRWQL